MKTFFIKYINYIMFALSIAVLSAMYITYKKNVVAFTSGRIDSEAAYIDNSHEENK